MTGFWVYQKKLSATNAITTATTTNTATTTTTTITTGTTTIVMWWRSEFDLSLVIGDLEFEPMCSNELQGWHKEFSSREASLIWYYKKQYNLTSITTTTTAATTTISATTATTRGRMQLIFHGKGSTYSA